MKLKLLEPKVRYDPNIQRVLFKEWMINLLIGLIKKNTIMLNELLKSHDKRFILDKKI